MAEKQQRLGEKEKKKDDGKLKMRKRKSHRDEKEKERLKRRLSKSQEIPMRGQVVRVPFIMCDQCDSWMHMSCVPFEIELECVDDALFVCNDCTT